VACNSVTTQTTDEDFFQDTEKQVESEVSEAAAVRCTKAAEPRQEAKGEIKLETE
jgi:hypothetical protein